MATITTVTRDPWRPTHTRHTSGAADPSADTVEIDVDAGYAHVFIGVRMFDSVGTQISVATAGTFTVDVKTLTTELFEAPPTPTIDATAPLTISVAGNVRQVRVVPTGVVGNDVTTWRVVVICNKS